MQTIDEYIKSQPPIVVDGFEREYRQADLARDMKVHSNALTKLKALGWKVAEGRLWSPKRFIKQSEAGE